LCSRHFYTLDVEVKYLQHRAEYSPIRLGHTTFADFFVSFFIRKQDKLASGVGCRSPPQSEFFSKKFRLEERVMSFNYGKEERKWRLWKEAEEKKLRSLGVSEDTIEKLRVHDWAVFNSDRKYNRRLRDAGTYLEDFEANIAPSEIKTVEDFLNSIENQKLYQALIMVDRLTLQIVLMKIQGYSTREIASYLDITEKAVYRRMDRLKEKLKKIF